jgi:hypothetical protein
MHSSLLFSLFLSCSSFRCAIANDVQGLWQVPSLPDFSTTFYNHETVTLSWVGWNQDEVDEYLHGEPVNHLWVVAFDYDETEYSQPVAGEGKYPVDG